MKWQYVKNWDEFVRKFRILYPEITDCEIANFILIYVQNIIIENRYEKGDFLLNDQTLINKICFLGPYLAQSGDYKYV